MQYDCRTLTQMKACHISSYDFIQSDTQDFSTSMLQVITKANKNISAKMVYISFKHFIRITFSGCGTLLLYNVCFFISPWIK